MFEAVESDGKRRPWLNRERESKHKPSENRLELHTRRGEGKKSTRKRKNIGFNKSPNDPFFGLNELARHCFSFSLVRLMLRQGKKDSTNGSTQAISCLMRMTPFPLTHVQQHIIQWPECERVNTPNSRCLQANV